MLGYMGREKARVGGTLHRILRLDVAVEYGIESDDAVPIHVKGESSIWNAGSVEPNSLTDVRPLASSPMERAATDRQTIVGVAY
jgi:hypothetical protein